MTQNVLSNKGKEKLFRAFEEYVDAKIAVALNKSPPIEVEKATKELKEMIMALEIETVGVKQC